jgi:hypothetical protein
MMLPGGMGEPHQPYSIRITPEDLYECAKKFLSGADDIAGTRETLARTLGGIVGGMAGNDQTGKQWAASFDKALYSLFRTLGAAVTSVDGMGQGLIQAANNVLAADHKSAIGQSEGKPFSYPMPYGPYTWQADPGIPPAAGAGSPVWPSPLDKIPNGHQDRLRAAAGALRHAADSLQDSGFGLENSIAQVTNVNSAASVDAMTGYFGLIWSPGDGQKPGPLYASYESCLKLARACADYAAQIDQAHHAVEMAIPHALEGWKGWLAGAIAIGGIALTFFTGTASDEAAAAIDTGLLASELTPALAALADALDGAIGALDAIIATLESAADAAPAMDIAEAETAEETDLLTEAADESEGIADLDPPDISSPEAKLFENGPPKASDLEEYAQEQGWTRGQTPNGPVKYTDENGVVRMTIKRGSPRTPGSENPHVELRNGDGIRVDPYGNPVARTSPANHTPIIWDLG